LLGEPSSLSEPLTQRAHEHGLADLAIAQDGQQWWLELRLPLADLVGFERLPEGQEEASAVLGAVRALADESLQLDPPCPLQSVTARLEPGGAIDLERGLVPQAGPASAAGPRADDDAHGHAHDHAHEHDAEHESADDTGHSGHADLFLTLIYQCPSPGPLRLQLSWPAEAGTQPRVRAQWLLESGQGGAELPSTATQLRWRRDD
jgi:hypothetical protein